MKKQDMYIIAIIITAVFCVWFYVYKSNNEQQTRLIEQATIRNHNATVKNIQTATTTAPDLTPIIPQAKVSTEGWKTCRNDEYGYEFKYPKEWFMYDDSSKDGKRIAREGKNCQGGSILIRTTKLENPNYLNEKGISYEFIINSDQKENIDIQYIKGINEQNQRNSELSPVSRQNMTIEKIFEINGVKALLLDHRLTTSNLLLNKNIILENNKNTWGLTINGQKEDSMEFYSDTFETILSTFKFL